MSDQDPNDGMYVPSGQPTQVTPGQNVEQDHAGTTPLYGPPTTADGSPSAWGAGEPAEPGQPGQGYAVEMPRSGYTPMGAPSSTKK